MMLFHGTFRSDHMLGDFWVEILAVDEVHARAVLDRQFPHIWASCWPADQFDAKPFTGGRIGRFHAFRSPGGALSFRRVHDDELLGRAEIKPDEITEDVV